MQIRFTSGTWVKFHGTLDRRRVIMRGKALEDGMTSVATKFRLQVDDLVLRVPGQNIFEVERLPSSSNSQPQ